MATTDPGPGPSGGSSTRLAQIERRLEAEQQRFGKRADGYQLRCGRLLNDARPLVPYGQWEAWLAEHFFGARRTAEKWVQWVEHPEKYDAEKAYYRERMHRVNDALAGEPNASDQTLFDHDNGSVYGDQDPSDTTPVADASRWSSASTAPDYPQPFGLDEIAADAFAYYRGVRGFPYPTLPLHCAKEQINALAQTAPDKLLHTYTASRAADSYHPHRFDCHAEGKLSPRSAFDKDRLLRRAISEHLSKGASLGEGYFGTLNLVSNTQGCSNFRPGAAVHFLRRFCPAKRGGAVLLDCCAGYGGRLVGAIASGVVGHYIGIDPSTRTHSGNLRLAADLGWAGRVELLNMPVEDITDELHQWQGRVDLALTSPPYYLNECYCDEPTQARVRYPYPNDWRERFLLPMLRLQVELLRPGAYALVNINDVTIKGKNYPLVDWCLQAAKQVGLQYVERLEYPLGHAWGANQPERAKSEPMLVFRRKQFQA